MAQYKIQQGDTLSALARKYGTTVDALMEANQQIEDRDLIYYDRMMNVPGAVASAPPTSVPTYAGGPSVASVEEINQAVNQSPVISAPSSPADYGQSTTASQSDIDQAIAAPGGIFADAFGSVKDYIAASRQEQLAKEAETGTATGVPVFTPPEMQARSQEGQPTLGELYSSAKGGIEDFVATTTPPTTDPYQIMQGGSPIDALSPIKDSVIKSANKAGNAVKELIIEAPDAMKGALNNFANNEIAPILAGLNRADRFIKDGDLSFLMKKYTDSVTKQAKEGAESFAKNIGIIRRDFVDTLSDFAQDNNLDVRSLVEAIDVDALYDATGIRNKRKDREQKIMKAKLEAERNARMANLQNQNASQINTMVQPTSSYAGGGLAQQAANVASRGRYGDTMLMHVNPAEVAGLSQVMPLTVNPDTGQPEAFLPFLLPLLGSVAAPALLGSTAIGTALGGAGLAALGSGLGTWAATGDAKKGLMSGLMGYGIGKVLGAGATAAQTAAAPAKDAAFAAANPATATLASTPTNAMADYTAALAKNPNLATDSMATLGAGTPFQSIADIASSPKAGIAGAIGQAAKPSTFMPMYVGAAGYGMMNSQEEFNRAMENLKTNNTEEYNRILAQHPEYVPMLQQNQTYQGYAQGGQAKTKKEWKPTAAIQARDIDPYFMAGLQGERGYLQNVNPSSGQIISGKTGYDFGTEMANAPMAEAFNPTQTVGYQSFYNAPREPYVLDPYAKQTFEAPPPPSAPPPPPIVEPAIEEESAVTLPVPPPEESIVEPFSPASNIVEEGPHTISHDYATGLSREGKEELDTGVPLNYMDILSPSAGAKHSSFEPHSSIPSVINDYNAYLGGQGSPQMSGLSRDEIESGSYAPSILSSVLAPPSAPPVASIPSVGRGQDRDLASVAQPSLNIGSIPTELPQEAPTRVTSDELRNRRRSGGGRYRKAEGGLTDYQEGGLTQEAMSDPLTQEVIQYITGQSGNDEVISQFVNKYGNEAFMQIREMALQQLATNEAQIEGLVSGNDQGGMSDDIPMTVSGDPAAVSQGEFIVPADVVSGIGDGDTNSGAEELYSMMDRVRQQRTGTTQQAPQLANAGGLMPA